MRTFACPLLQASHGLNYLKTVQIKSLWNQQRLASLSRVAAPVNLAVGFNPRDGEKAARRVSDD